MMASIRRQQDRTSWHREGSRLLERLAVPLVLLLLTSTLALAQGPIPAKPSPETRREISRLIDDALPHFDINPKRVPARFRRQVIQHVYNYSMLYRDDMQDMIQRAAIHLPMIKRILRQYDVPTYFAYIPLVESRFRPDVTHPQSGARGLWQLMATTARGFGLEVSKQVDERLDPARATQAAARYLRKLEERFGPNAPLHILAAYNHGDSILVRRMKRARTRDIWYLYTYRRLPYQTREYMIKMVALWVVMAHPSHFQITPETVASDRTATPLHMPWAIPLVASLHPSPTATAGVD